jgi:hypothetical protein
MQNDDLDPIVSNHEQHEEMINFSLSALYDTAIASPLTDKEAKAAFEQMTCWLEQYPYIEEDADCCCQFEVSYTAGNPGDYQTRTMSWSVCNGGFSFDHSLITCDSETGSDSLTFLDYRFEAPSFFESSGHLDSEQLLTILKEIIELGAKTRCGEMQPPY